MSPLSALGGLLVGLLREVALYAGVLLLLASVLSLYFAWNGRRTASLLEETPRSEIRDVHSPGTVRVRGTVVPHTETFTSPIAADERSVLAAWTIEERDDTPKTKSWEDAARGVHAVPFYLEDDSGRLLVDLDDTTVGNLTDDVFTPETLLVSTGVSTEGLRCEFDSFDVHVETDYGERPPERVTEFLETTDGVSVDPMATDLVVDESQRKYREQTLRVGDEVSLLGHATPRREGLVSTSGPGDLVVSQVDESVTYLSTGALEDLADSGGGFLFGLLTAVVGVGLLAVRFLL